jgi:hypothetical protein
MRAKDDLTAIGDQLLDGRKCANQTCSSSVIFPSMMRNVEIATAEDSLTFYVDVINSLLVKCHITPFLLCVLFYFKSRKKGSGPIRPDPKFKMSLAVTLTVDH